ncbi:S-adenosyl-L-methionine-dependent methyltransferase [Peniophora sp. CONT]|nr:S-adenosyl-L-methionine-dependent methyltransferase [Peniophora sp. CONT]
MPKRLFSHCLMPGRRVRQKVVDSDEEVVEASTSASARGPPTRNRVQSGGGLEYVAADSAVRFTSVGSSDEDPDPDTNMLDAGAEQDAQTVADSDEERVSSRSVSSRLPTPGPSRSVRKRPSEVFVAVPSRHPRSTSRSTRRQTEAYDDDVVMNDGSAIMDRSAGLMTPRITRTPSSSAAPPPDDDEEVMPEQYDPPAEETLESEELVDLLDELNLDEEADEEDQIVDFPVRYLDDFALYSQSSSTMMDFWELALLAKEQLQALELVASGIVSPRPRTDENEEEIKTDFDPEDVPRIQLTTILEIDHLWWYDDEKRLDPDIWIRTTHAWYILREPHQSYAPHMRPFALAHYNIYAMAEYALTYPRVSLSTFLDELDSDSNDEDGIHVQIDGPPLIREECEAALKDARVLHIIGEIRQDARPLRRAVLFQRLKDPSTASSRAPSASAAPSEAEESSAPPSRGRARKRPDLKRKKSSKNPELQILEDKNEGTVLTPRVSKIAEELLHFKPARDESVFSTKDQKSTSRPPSRKRSSTVHDSNPKKIVWGKCVAREGKTSFYECVTIDGERYQPGDLVMLEPGADPKKTREKASRIVHTTNLLGHKNWFGLIEYLHDDGGRTPSLHVRWFAHSSKTLLQEFSHPNELFWLKECADCELSSILQKCALDVLPEVGAVGEEPDVGDMPDDHFFHRNLYYDEDGIAWTDLPPDIIQKALATCKPHKQCISCGLDELDERHDSLILLDDEEGFVTGGLEYHRHECVYLYGEDDPNGAFDLAQVLSWEKVPTRSKDRHALKLSLTVRYFHRRDDLTRKERLAGIEGENWKMDERHIFFTARQEEISSDRIAGKFYLRRREPKNKDWLLDNPDVFYCTHEAALAGSQVERDSELEKMPKNSLQRCDHCFDAMMKHDERLRKVQRLDGLEIFAGGGGLSEGTKPMIDTRWVVEFSEACALTLGANHPDAIIYNQDCNKVLQHNLDLLEGKEPEPLRSLGKDQAELPPLPKRGEVDIIFGGPPCQSFSRANHHKKDDDPRSMLALVLLSYAELLEPDYVIIENVVGFVDHKATLHDGRQVAAAMVKIVVRVGVALGFQVHARIIQAAQLGVPQGRRRFIIIMARRGLPLPAHPLPSHVYKAAQKAHLPTGQTLRGPSRATHGFLTERARSAYYDEVPSAAPHRTVTVEQAVGDLPKFHWQRPGKEIDVSEEERREEDDLRASGIPVVDAVSTRRHDESRFVGFPGPEEYPDVARSTYQHVVRSDTGRVSMHYTMPYSEEAVERVTAVPMRPRANWSNLPQGLSARVKNKPGRKPPNIGMLLRLPADDVFATSMTSAYPLSKTGSVLHYDQRRSLTTRESARAQGFPDDYTFCAASKNTSNPRLIIQDQQRQIGNAVPVPLARAFAERSLRPALLARYELEGRESSNEGSPEV